MAQGETKTRWIIGLMITAVLAIVGAWLASPIGPFSSKPPMSGHITGVDYISQNVCCGYSVAFNLKGFKGQQATLAYIIEDAYSGNDGQETAFTPAVPESDDDSARAPVNVPINRRGRYRVIFVLLDPSGTELDRAQTADINVG
jgi:hypothetical protein